MNKRKGLIIAILSIIVIIIALVVILIVHQNTNVKEDDTIKEKDGISIVSTMDDVIAKDSAWCGTFQLVWNDMKNEVIKKDIEFPKKSAMVDNLNKGSFNTDMISDEYYYKIYGLKTLKLKEAIENGIKDKFNQESDIINSFGWGPGDVDNGDGKTKRYLFYTMLYRKFEYLSAFEVLDDGDFRDTKDVKYFGINSESNYKVRNQITVLYYNSKDDFAITIDTKTGDKVVFCKNPEGDTFRKIWDNMKEKSKNNSGEEEHLKKDDKFKAPNIKFDELREYTELENQQFISSEGDICIINKAMQTIKFELDEKGGEIKSEAGIDMTMGITSVSGPKKERHFYVDDTFALFLLEDGKETPYFAARINDITKFQD